MIGNDSFALLSAARLHNLFAVVLQMAVPCGWLSYCAACAMARSILCRWTLLWPQAHTQQRLQ